MINFSHIPLFQGIEPAEMERIKKKVLTRTYPKGVTVFVEGQETDGLYVVYSGLVKVFMLHRDGREKTLAIFSEGEVLGEVTLFGSDLRSATVETLEMTTFLVISRADFQALLLEFPKLSFRIIETLSARLRKANRQIEELTFLNARNRVICNLVRLIEEHGDVGGNEKKISLRLTHAELAKLVGVTRETVTKVLTDLQDINLIRITRGHLQVFNPDELYKQVM